MTRILGLLPLAAFVAACASASSVPTPLDHPASTSAPSTSVAVAVTAFDPAPQPDLPAPLRPKPASAGAGMQASAGSMIGSDSIAVEGHDMAAMNPDRTTNKPVATMETDEAAVRHMAQHHGGGAVGDDDASEGALPPDGLAGALDAYLAIQDALASDRRPSTASVRAFDAAVAALVEAPPQGDPHFWHMRAAEVQAVQAGAAGLAAVADPGSSSAQALNAVRVAFGELSEPFARWVEVLGVPEGYDVVRFTCGTFSAAPEGGVWLQRAGDTRNPYYGSAMLTCGTQDGPMPHRNHEGMDHDGMNHDDQ